MHWVDALPGTFSGLFVAGGHHQPERSGIWKNQEHVSLGECLVAAPPEKGRTMNNTQIQHHSEARTLGMASLALGFAGFLPIPGIVASALALVLGYLSRAKSREQGQEVNGMA